MVFVGYNGLKPRNVCLFFVSVFFLVSKSRSRGPDVNSSPFRQTVKVKSQKVDATF